MDIEKNLEEQESSSDQETDDSAEDEEYLPSSAAVWAKKTLAYIFILIFSVCVGFFGSWAAQKVRRYFRGTVYYTVSLSNFEDIKEVISDQ